MVQACFAAFAGSSCSGWHARRGCSSSAAGRRAPRSPRRPFRPVHENEEPVLSPQKAAATPEDVRAPRFLSMRIGRNRRGLDTFSQRCPHGRFGRPRPSRQPAPEKRQHLVGRPVAVVDRVRPMSAGTQYVLGSSCQTRFARRSPGEAPGPPGTGPAGSPRPRQPPRCSRQCSGAGSFFARSSDGAAGRSERAREPAAFRTARQNQAPRVLRPGRHGASGSPGPSRRARRPTLPRRSRPPPRPGA